MNSHDKQHSQSAENSWLHRVLEGRIVTGDFFRNHLLQIILLLGMILVYITNRYSCQRSMEEIRSLNNRLQVVETESFRVRGYYMSRIRESSMRDALDSLGIRLSVQTQPPFILDSDK